MARSAFGQTACAAFAATAFLISPATADDRVGVAAAVTPQATSKPPGAGTRTLKIGKSIFYNERITTSKSGVVQVLLVDGSTFTVGPSSNLVIDAFVYDPRTGTGKLAATLSKGALRFVGGKLSKSAPGVKVKTPAGALTVRGGIFQGIVNSRNQAVFAFVFGDSLSLVRGGSRYTLRDNGKLFAIGNAGPPIMRTTTLADTNLILAAISGRGGAKTYKTKATPWPFYYGIQPTGRYPDQPFIRERYYDGANPIRLHKVPQPQVRAPERPRIVRPPLRDLPRPRPRPPIPTDNVNLPGVSCPNC